MQQLKVFSLLILSVCFFSGCSGNADGTNNRGVRDTPKASDIPAASSASGNAAFSYNLLMESLRSRIQTLAQINSKLNLHRLSPINN